MPVKQRRKLIDAHDNQLSLTAQCRMLSLHRSVYYYKPKGISAADLNLMQSWIACTSKIQHEDHDGSAGT
jgi:hypothetical protein